MSMALSAKAAGVSVAAVACTATVTAFVPSAPLARMPANAKGDDQLHTDALVGVETSGCGYLQNAGLLAGVVGAAAIFTQRKISRQSSQQTRVIRRAFENELGVQPPVGFWDPLGFTDDGDAFEFRRRRCVELKHGRVSMLACIGYIVPEYFRWPGYLSPSAGLKFADIPHGLAAITKVPAVGWTQVVFFGLAMELFAAYQSPDLPPGKLSSRLVVGLTEIKDWTNNYQFGPFGIINAPPIADPDLRKKKLNSEIANGRLAMFAIMAMMFQNGTVGTTGPEMWLPPAASKVIRRAFENELGVQPPVGFWDPLGFTDDGDAFEFRRRRCVELKHGRVSMLACIGYIVPEYFRWPGYLSPSAGLKFADIPHGLAAITKVPAVGWTQVVFFGLAMELFAAYQSPDLPPGKLSSRLVVGLTEIKDWTNNYTFGPFGIVNAPSIADPELRKKKLNSEIANGRLAMFAIMAMMFQNGTVGTTGPEMWLPPAANKVISRAFENELGVQPPVGFWDPLGFTDDGDAFEFRRRRCVELKHGRVSMLACIGYIVPEYFRWPGYLSPSAGLKFADVPHGLAAITKVPAVGWTQVVFFGLAMELFAAYQSPDLPPGKLSSRLVVGLTEIKDWTNNYQFGPFGIINAPPIADPEVRKKKLNSEIANGRLAMFAIMAMMFQNGTVGTTGPEMWLPPAVSKAAFADAVARRAFDKELGATAPFKYFDPLGLAKDGDEGDFRRRRISEIKNGRVAMIACIGYMVPEYFRWPGYLSPSAGIKFADLPNGVEALYKMPAEGWAQIGVFIAFLELFPLRQNADRAPGDAPGCGKLGIPYFLFGGASGTKCDPVGSERSLTAELNNGRLAMMAITGMVSQNALIGTTGPEMWLPGS